MISPKVKVIRPDQKGMVVPPFLTGRILRPKILPGEGRGCRGEGGDCHVGNSRNLGGYGTGGDIVRALSVNQGLL